MKQSDTEFENLMLARPGLAGDDGGMEKYRNAAADRKRRMMQ